MNGQSLFCNKDSRNQRFTDSQLRNNQSANYKKQNNVQINLQELTTF